MKINIKKILKQLSLEEKVAQLCSVMDHQLLENGELTEKRLKKFLPHGIGFLTSISRHIPREKAVKINNAVQKYLMQKTRPGLPAISLEECLHGCMITKSTVFPQAIGMAATWDLELFSHVAEAIGKETRALGITLALTPVLDVARDVRAGRTEETYGEDTWMVGRFGVAFIKAMQAQGVACTPKHFAANFVAEGGRDSFDVPFSERELREVYFPPYKAAIDEADAQAFMPSYNSINGRPDACNSWLLIDVLRDEWGFKGITGSDYWSIDGIQTRQFLARDRAEAARLALVNGMDVEWPNGTCYRSLVQEVRKGRIPMKVLNRSVERVLRLKQRQGLFENPFGDEAAADRYSGFRVHRQLALETARSSFVLLKNKSILPLSKQNKKIALIGPNAAEIRTGGYSSRGSHIVTPLEGLRKRLGKNLIFERGCGNGNDKEKPPQIKKAVAAARKADLVIMCMGNNAGGGWVQGAFTEGESNDRSDLRLMGYQEELINEVCKVNKNVIVVLLTGSAVIMYDWLDKVKAVMVAWYPGCEGGTALAEVLFGDAQPGGRLPITFPKKNGQLPLYYNPKPTGRVYDYVDLRGTQARFPFGHGLTYTKFDYSRLKVKKQSKNKSKPFLDITCRVKNTGRRAGPEVVQLYIHHKYSTLTRPLKQLKGFQKILLNPNKGENINFRLYKKDLEYLGPKLKPIFEGGDYEVMVGRSSGDIRLSETVSF